MNRFLAALCAILVIFSGFLWMKVTQLENQLSELRKPALYDTMTLMQTVVHKISYAIDHENAELLDFYIHELEEAAEELVEANLVYHDQPVGQLTESMLEPAIDDLEEVLESGDWERVRQRNRVMIQACNSCHAATGYPAIVITERAERNPFNQDFSKQN